jgi:hypothetical protein
LPQQERFETTHWSLVLAAGRGADTAAHAALETLCGRFWFPLYAYVRRRVRGVEEAQDLTQEFFARLLEKQVLARASPGRGTPDAVWPNALVDNKQPVAHQMRCGRMHWLTSKLKQHTGWQMALRYLRGLTRRFR